VVSHQAADVLFTPDYELPVDPHCYDPAVPQIVPAGSRAGFNLAVIDEADVVNDGRGDDRGTRLKFGI
jgi:hypothetical protein